MKKYLILKEGMIDYYIEKYRNYVLFEECHVKMIINDIEIFIPKQDVNLTQRYYGLEEAIQKKNKYGGIVVEFVF